MQKRGVVDTRGPHVLLTPRTAKDTTNEPRRRGDAKKDRYISRGELPYTSVRLARELGKSLFLPGNQN